MDGGKMTLRLVSTGDVVEYAGELEGGGGASKIRARVAATDGRIDVEELDGAAPAWLLAFVRATLRSAWRASVAGTAWPLRVSRWRPGSGGDAESCGGTRTTSSPGALPRRATSLTE